MLIQNMQSQTNVMRSQHFKINEEEREKNEAAKQGSTEIQVEKEGGN
jgi:hypothetical protein